MFGQRRSRCTGRGAAHLASNILLIRVNSKTVMYSEEGGSVSLEHGLHGLDGGSLDGSGLGEDNTSLSELLGLLTSGIGVGNDGSLDDLDGLSSSGVTSTHLHVELGDGSAEGGVSEFLVHVDGSGTGIVSEEDTVVSHDSGSLLEDLGSGDDLTLDSSDLVLSLHVIPELGSSEDLVSAEDSDSVESGGGAVLSG